MTNKTYNTPWTELKRLAPEQIAELAKIMDARFLAALLKAWAN